MSKVGPFLKLCSIRIIYERRFYHCLGNFENWQTNFFSFYIIYIFFLIKQILDKAIQTNRQDRHKKMIYRQTERYTKADEGIIAIECVISRNFTEIGQTSFFFLIKFYISVYLEPYFCLLQFDVFGSSTFVFCPEF